MRLSFYSSIIALLMAVEGSSRVALQQDDAQDHFLSDSYFAQTDVQALSHAHSHTHEDEPDPEADKKKKLESKIKKVEKKSEEKKELKLEKEKVEDEKKKLELEKEKNKEKAKDKAKKATEANPKPEKGMFETMTDAVKDAPQNIADNAKAAAKKIADTGNSIKDSLLGTTTPQTPPKPKAPKAPKKNKKPAPKQKKPPKPPAKGKPKPPPFMGIIPAITPKVHDRPHSQHSTPEGLEFELSEHAEIHYLEQLLDHMEQSYNKKHKLEVQRTVKLLDTQKAFIERVASNDKLAKDYMRRAMTTDPAKLAKYDSWVRKFYSKQHIKESQDRLEMQDKIAEKLAEKKDE